MSIRRALDIALNGNSTPATEQERAVIRGLRVLADAQDEANARLKTIISWVAVVAGGVIITVISTALLLALRSGAV